MLDYKTKWYGAKMLKAPTPMYIGASSKTCSACGAIKDALTLSERIFECDVCGSIIDRDENAARNLEKLSALLENETLTESTASFAGSNPDLSGWRYLWRRNESRYIGIRSTSHVSLNQEADTTPMST